MQILIILFSLTISSVHDLHLSMCSINFNEEAQRLEIQQRIFYDDLEKALQFRLDDPRFDILNPSESALSYDSLLLAYMNDHIDLNINEKQVELSLLDYEISGDALVLYLFESNLQKIDRIEILSHLLFEIFNDQDNVVSISAYKQKKSQRFSTSSKPFILSFADH